MLRNYLNTVEQRPPEEDETVLVLVGDTPLVCSYRHGIWRSPYLPGEMLAEPGDRYLVIDELLERVH